MADNVRKIQHTKYVPFDLDNYVYYHNDGKAITPANVGGLHPFEYTNWVEEMMSWHDNCYIHAGLNPANIYRVSGPDALKFFSDICVNTFNNFPIGKGKHRTGWVNMHDHPILEQIAGVSMEPQFTHDTIQVKKKTDLVDDPINVSGTLCTLKKGAKVTVLAREAPLFYVEAAVGGKTYRGYVESEYLERNQY